KRNTPAERWCSPPMTWARSSAATPTCNAVAIRLPRSVHSTAIPWTSSLKDTAWTRPIPISSTCPKAPGLICKAKKSFGAANKAIISINFPPAKRYARLSVQKVHIKNPAMNRSWRLVGTVAEGLLCHKPCTVSGGGKSEISKPITDAILTGPVFVADFKRDFDSVAALIDHDYSDRFIDKTREDKRPVLAADSSLG